MQHCSVAADSSAPPVYRRFRQRRWRNRQRRKRKLQAGRRQPSLAGSGGCARSVRRRLRRCSCIRPIRQLRPLSGDEAAGGPGAQRRREPARLPWPFLASLASPRFAFEGKACVAVRSLPFLAARTGAQDQLPATATAATLEYALTFAADSLFLHSAGLYFCCRVAASRPPPKPRLSFQQTVIRPRNCPPKLGLAPWPTGGSGSTWNHKTGNHRGGVGKEITHNTGNHRAPSPSPPLRHTDDNDGDDVVHNDIEIDVLFPVLLVVPFLLCCSGLRQRMFTALFS